MKICTRKTARRCVVASLILAAVAIVGIGTRAGETVLTTSGKRETKVVIKKADRYTPITWEDMEPPHSFGNFTRYRYIGGDASERTDQIIIWIQEQMKSRHIRIVSIDHAYPTINEASFLVMFENDEPVAKQ